MRMKGSRARKFQHQQNINTLKNLPSSLSNNESGRDFIRLFENLARDRREGLMIDDLK